MSLLHLTSSDVQILSQAMPPRRSTASPRGEHVRLGSWPGERSAALSGPQLARPLQGAGAAHPPARRTRPARSWPGQKRRRARGGPPCVRRAGR